MFRNGGERHVEVVREFCNGAACPRRTTEDLAPRLTGQRTKHLVEVGMTVNHVVDHKIVPIPLSTVWLIVTILYVSRTQKLER